MERNNNIREFANALVSIKGNVLRCQNSIYSIHNIVSITFDSVKREKEWPKSIDDRRNCAKTFLRYFVVSILFLIVLVVAEALHIDKVEFYINLPAKWIARQLDVTVNDVFKYFIISIPSSLILSVLMFVFSILTKWCYQKNKHYYIHGLKIVFVNNFILLLASRVDNGFIKETINQLQEFVSNPKYDNKNELIINFFK